MLISLLIISVKASSTDIKAYYQEIYNCLSEDCTKSAKYGLVFLFYECWRLYCLVKLIWEYISKMPMTGKRKRY